MGYLQVNKGSSLKNFILTITLAIAALPFINLLSHINQQIELPAAMAGIEAWMKQSEEMAEALINSFLAADNYGTMLFNIFLMAVLPAFSEELFFRGALQNLLSSKNKKHLAIWISAIIFSAIHLQFYGFFPRMLMGVAFGYMLVWSGSLWIPIVAHFTNNAFAVVSHYIITKNEYNMESFELFGTGKTLWVGLLSGVLMCGILYLLRRSLTMSKASSRISSGN